MAVAGLFLASGAALAENYYVDQSHASSSDSNPGTESLPWKTMQRINTAPLTAGDTVYVKSGVYYLSSGGTWTTPIVNPPDGVIVKSLPKHGAILDGSRRSDASQALIGSYNNHNVVIDGFEVRNASTKGVVVFGANNVQIINNRIHNVTLSNGDNTDGIRIENASGTLVKNNEIFDVRNCLNSSASGCGGGSTVNAAGIKVYFSDNNIFENNEIYNVRNAVYDKNNNTNSHYRKNYIHDCNAAWEFLTGSGSAYPSRGHRVYENVVRNCSTVIYFPDPGGQTRIVDDISVYNNVFIGYNTGIIPPTQGVIDIYNNIFHKGGNGEDLRAYDDPADNIRVMDYNLFVREPSFVASVYQSSRRNYSSLSAWNSATGNDGNSSVADPLFSNTTGMQYSLRPDSPAQDAGRIGGVASGQAVDQGVFPTGNIGVIGLGVFSSVPKSPVIVSIQ